MDNIEKVFSARAKHIILIRSYRDKISKKVLSLLINGEKEAFTIKLKRDLATRFLT